MPGSRRTRTRPRTPTLLDDLPEGIPAIAEAARNVIVHYRSGVDIPADRLAGIDSRWVERILAADQARHPRPLTVPLGGRREGRASPRGTMIELDLHTRRESSLDG